MVPKGRACMVVGVYNTLVAITEVHIVGSHIEYFINKNNFTLKVIPVKCNKDAVQ